MTPADLGIATAPPRTTVRFAYGSGRYDGRHASDSGTFSVPSPAETATIAGVIELMITGAFFIVGGKRRMRPGAA